MKLSTKVEIANAYPPPTPLFDLPDREFATGGLIGEAVKAAGHINGGRSVINSYNWWSRPLAEVLADLEQEKTVE